MADAEWLENIRKIAMQAVEAGDPCDILSGQVVGAAPLSVQIDQKTTLREGQILVPERLTDHMEQMVIPEIGEVIVTVKNGLNAGDRVLLIQKRGGQMFVVLDRW